MGVWDQFKKAKEAGARFLDRIDEVEREARENDPHKEARRLAFKASETELTGGVEELEDLDLAEAIPEVFLELDEELDEAFGGEESSASVFDSLVTGPSFIEDMKSDELSLSDEMDLDFDETGTVGSLVTSEFTELESELLFPDDTIAVEQTAERGPLDFPDHTSTGELTATGERTEAISTKLANTLNFTEPELTTILRGDHYPQLKECPVALLIDLARFEQRLLDLGEVLGRAVFRLLRETVQANEDWEAAVWTTGAHWDHTVREAALSLDRDSEDLLLVRTLGWAFWPFTDELLSAAVGLEDPVGIGSVVGDIERVLDARWGHVGGGGEDLEAEGDHMPIRPRGVFSFEGFRWLD